MKQVKWGVIGPGRIAEKFVKDLALEEDAQLWAIASRDLSRAASFATKYGAKNYFGSYREMLEKSDLDIVYVASPHTFHQAHSEKF